MHTKSLASHYRPATTDDVHTWSFGRVNRVRSQVAATWSEKIGTLDDERIFGTLRDYQCSCGKYEGRKHQNMICDRCGVKIMTSREARTTRCGHIDLTLAVLHPLDRVAQPVEAIPILPAAVWQSPAGCALADLYDDIVRASSLEDETLLNKAVQALVQILLPVVEMAHAWDLESAPLLARGLVLARRASS
jgi:hypothetical protein